MIDKNERQFFRGEDMSGVYAKLAGGLSGAGITLQQVGVNQWQGKGMAESYGMVQKVGVSMTPVQGGFFVDIRVSADFTGTAIIVLIVCWLFCLPAALVFAYLGYQDWNWRAGELFRGVWAPVAPQIAPAPGPQWPGAPAGGA